MMKEERIERKRLMRELARKVAGMTDEEKQAVLGDAPIVTIEGHALSRHTQCMIAFQSIGQDFPTIVGGYRQWQKAGRQVRKGEHGLTIWCPTGPKKTDEESGETDTDAVRFILGTVFDISQTDELESAAA
jgi:hypothetical protein